MRSQWQERMEPGGVKDLEYAPKQSVREPGDPVVNLLRNAAGSSAGIDGETWSSYGERLEENLQSLSEALKRGRYRAKPMRRTFIAKADGKQQR